jgi:hypothetical protein
MRRLTINHRVCLAVALVESVKLNEMIDSSTLPNDDEDDENNEIPATGCQEAVAPVFGFLNSDHFPDL